MVREAFILLELYVGCQVPVMHDALGNEEDGDYYDFGNNGYPQISNKIVVNCTPISKHKVKQLLI